MTSSSAAQMGLLRLLSNPAIMGDDAVDRSEAWRIYDQLWADERVLWADEPAPTGCGLACDLCACRQEP
jgi:hypothetical protein